MAVIKLNASGQVILRGGLPSCTCCGYPALYVEHFENPAIGYVPGPNPDPFGPEVISYFTMTGSVETGFTGTGPGGVFTLVYDVGTSRWFMTDPVYGVSGVGFGSTNPANPASFYYDNGFVGTSVYAHYLAILYLTPLP